MITLDVVVTGTAMIAAAPSVAPVMRAAVQARGVVAVGVVGVQLLGGVRRSTGAGCPWARWRSIVATVCWQP